MREGDLCLPLDGLDAAGVRASISALTFFNVSNRHALTLIFDQGKQLLRVERCAI